MTGFQIGVLKRRSLKVTIDIESVVYTTKIHTAQQENFVNVVTKHSWAKPTMNSAQPASWRRCLGIEDCENLNLRKFIIQQSVKITHLKKMKEYEVLRYGFFPSRFTE